MQGRQGEHRGQAGPHLVDGTVHEQGAGQGAGDGTTTSTIMTQAIINNGIRAVTSGINPVALNSGIKKAARMVAEEVKARATVS